MVLCKRLRLGFSAAVLLACMGAAATEAPDYQAGVKAYNEGNFDEAYNIFAALFLDDPQNLNVTYGLALSAVRKGKTSHALFAFDRVLALKPDDIRARLEIGRLYMKMGQLDLARKEFEAASRANPPPNVQQNIDAFLTAIEKAGKKWAVTGRLDLRMVYDDNLNFGPSSSTVDTLLGELTVMGESRPLDAWGGSIGASASGVYDPGERGLWQLIADAAGSQDFYDGAPGQEILFLQAGAGTRRVSQKLLLDLPARFSTLDYGHDDLMDITGINPVAAWLTTPQFHMIARLNLEDRDYQDNDLRDSGFRQATGTLRWIFADGRASASLSAGAFDESADGDAFSNNGWISGTALEASVPGGLLAYASAQFRQCEYGDILYPDLQDRPREDDQWQFIAGLRKDINQRWSLDLNHRFISNSSTFELYDYDKNVTTLTTSLSF